MDDEFADRAKRIRRERGDSATGPHRKGARRGWLRPVWLVVGTLLGLCAITQIKVITQNYDALRVLADQDQQFAEEMALRSLASLGLFALTAVLALILLVFYRRAMGFWNLAAGICLIGLSLGTYLSPALAPLLMGPKFFP